MGFTAMLPTRSTFLVLWVVWAVAKPLPYQGNGPCDGPLMHSYREIGHEPEAEGQPVTGDIVCSGSDNGKSQLE